MHQGQARGRCKFNYEIPVRNRVEGIFARPVESQFFGSKFPVNRKAGPCQRRGAKRQTGALSATGQLRVAELVKLFAVEEEA